jgi:hypothetical protein
LEAFTNRKVKLFDRWLNIGANPEQIVDVETNLSTFEMLCKEPEGSDYILKCLDYKADPNKVSILKYYDALYVKPCFTDSVNSSYYTIKSMRQLGW